MGLPTPQELQHALETAAKMREQGEDPDYLAKSLLNLNYRYGLMEQVLKHAKLYLFSGESPQEHALLVKAIEKLEQAQGPSDPEEVVV